MAKITFQDTWWTDPRRERLGEILGSLQLADGVMVEVWVTAFEYWRNGGLFIPAPRFQKIPHFEAVLESGLVKKRGARFYAKGSADCFKWVWKKIPDTDSGTFPSGGNDTTKKSPPHTLPRTLPRTHTHTNTKDFVFDENVFQSGTEEDNTATEKIRNIRKNLVRSMDISK